MFLLKLVIIVIVFPVACNLYRCKRLYFIRVNLITLYINSCNCNFLTDQDVDNIEVLKRLRTSAMIQWSMPESCYDFKAIEVSHDGDDKIIQLTVSTKLNEGKEQYDSTNFLYVIMYLLYIYLKKMGSISRHLTLTQHLLGNNYNPLLWDHFESDQISDQMALYDQSTKWSTNRLSR